MTLKEDQGKNEEKPKVIENPKEKPKVPEKPKEEPKRSLPVAFANLYD